MAGEGKTGEAGVVARVVPTQTWVTLPLRGGLEQQSHRGLHGAAREAASLQFAQTT